MPRPIWSGSISFGLVNVPVKVLSAVSSQDVRFHQLHAADNVRIQQKRVCPADGAEVPFDQIIKGYEIAPEQYVVITPDELAGLDPKATHTIDIEEFVDLDQIDPIFFEHPYYLAPDKRAEKPYGLLLRAMSDTKKVGIARFVLRTKQYLAAVRPMDGNALVLSTMLFADEVVSPSDIQGVGGNAEELSAKEITMATQLIESLSADFEPSKYHDEYREKVLEMIKAKAEGMEIVKQPAAAEPAKVVDLMAALEASVKAAKEKRKSA